MVVPQRALELESDPDSLSDLAFRTLSTAICDGTLECGETLRVDELRAWLGISRTPIREALARLSTLGLVATQPGRYTRVVRPDVEVHAETLEFLGYQGALLIRMTAWRLSQAELDIALTLLEQTEAAADLADPVAWRSSLRRFLEHLWAVANSSVARQVMGDFTLVIDANLRHAEIVPADHVARREAFARLREALAQRDADYAEYAFRVLYPPRCDADGTEQDALASA